MHCLRNYQSAVVTEFSAAINDAHRRIVVSCPTGAGKTVIALRGIAPLLSGPIGWATHRTELARQVEAYRACVDVQMIQRFDVSRPYRSIIIDEGHHVCAKQYQSLFDAYPDAVFIALTATPYRMDGVGLGVCGFTKIVYGPDILELTQGGFLCPARVLVPERETTGSWLPCDAAKQISATQFNKGIVYCRTVADAEETAGILSGLGIAAKAIHGEQCGKERARRERSFRRGQTKVVCNHTIFTEGYDVPSVDLVVLNRFTESRCLWRQMTGRGLRLASMKKYCTVLDLAGNSILHGSIYDKEIYDLSGHVERVESRDVAPSLKSEKEYEYNQKQGLKEWKPSPKPVSIRESLQKLKLKSPLHRLLTA